MVQFTTSQRKALSEFFNNAAVAWFAGGVIAPIIVRPDSVTDLLTTFSWGFAATIFFLQLSLEYAKERQ